MNKDLLIDAIGMVDEQTLREATDIKRTKRITGCVTVVMILLAVFVSVGAFRLVSQIQEDTQLYTVEMLTHCATHSNTVTVYPDDRSVNSFTIDIPSKFTQSLRLETWVPVEQVDLTEQNKRLCLRLGATTLTFYDQYATAEMYDWDRFEGTFAVPEGLWREITKAVAQTKQS